MNWKHFCICFKSFFNFRLLKHYFTTHFNKHNSQWPQICQNPFHTSPPEPQKPHPCIPSSSLSRGPFTPTSKFPPINILALSLLSLILLQLCLHSHSDLPNDIFTIVNIIVAQGEAGIVVFEDCEVVRICVGKRWERVRWYWVGMEWNECAVFIALIYRNIIGKAKWVFQLTKNVSGEL